MEFRCRLGTPGGEVTEGIYVAEDEARLRREFEEKGLYVLAVQRAGSLGRRLRRLAGGAAESDADPIARVADTGPSQEDALLSAELVRQTRRLVATLPAKLRDVLLLAGSGDYTYEEIATMTGAPVGTVKWRVSEARRALRRKLAALGYGRD